METQDQDFFGKLNLSLSALEKLEVSYVLGVGMGTAVGAHKQVRVGALQEGFNKGVALLGKVLQTVPHENSVPLYYLVADREANCFALSVYALREGAIREGNTVTLLEPFFHNVCVSWQGKTYQYKAIRVDLPQQLLLNGRPTLVQDAVCSTLQAENIAP